METNQYCVRDHKKVTNTTKTAIDYQAKEFEEAKVFAFAECTVKQFRRGILTPISCLHCERDSWKITQVCRICKPVSYRTNTNSVIMSQWNSEEDAAKAAGGWSNGPGPQQTQNPQSTAMETDESDRAIEQNSRGWGPSSEKQNSIVVDERDTESWPAIGRDGSKPGDGEAKMPSPSSSNATVSASLPTSNHNAMDTQTTLMADNPPPVSSANMMNSIWRNSGSSGSGVSTWEGGITTSPALPGKTVTTPTSQYQQQQQGFGVRNSAWDHKAPTPGANPGATSPNNSGDPSGWLTGPRTGATAEGPQDASGPKSSAGGVPVNNSAPELQPGKGPAASTSGSSWLPNTEPGLGFGSNPGATNTTNSANQPWNVPSHGFGAGNSSATWNKPGNPAQANASNNGAGWGSNPGSSWPPSSSSQVTGSSSWNAPPSSSNNNSMGWGGFKPDNSSNAPSSSHWGEPPSTSNPASISKQTPGQNSEWGKPDMGNKRWGESKVDTGVSQWGAPPPPSNTGWGDVPSSGPNNARAPEPSGWGGPPPSTSESNQGWGAPPPQQPNSWAQTASKGQEEKPVLNSLSASLDSTAAAKVNSNEGWGKTQINQNEKWDVEHSQSQNTGVRGSDDGTAAWGQTQAPPPSSTRAWGKEAPSAWGNPPQGPPKTPSGWGNPPPPTAQPPPAWSNPNSNQPENTNQSGRAWVVNSNNPSAAGNSQWGKPPPPPAAAASSSGKPGWGQPGPSDTGTGAWGRPPPSQWGDQQNQPPPSGPPPTGPPPSGLPPTGLPPTGPPPSGPPPSGPPPSGIPPSGPLPSRPPPPGPPPSGALPGPPPSVPPPSVPPPSNTDIPTSPEAPRIITGCSWQNMATTTVATGWGDLSDPPRKISADDGTYVWGDSNEHNMRISHNAKVNISRKAPPSGRPLSTMQQGDQPSVRPPSHVDGGTSAWGGDSSSTTKQWGAVTTKGDNGTAAWGAHNNKPGGVSQWDHDSSSNSPWGGRPSTTGSTKDTMQSGSWNEDNSGGVSAVGGGERSSGGGAGIGHWNDNEDKWESHSHSSESSVSSSGWRGPGGPRGPKQNRAAQQKESNHWISKLKRLMDQGYRKEEAEMALRKHNMHFESALDDLRQNGTFNHAKPDLDTQFSQMNIGGLLQGGGSLQDKSYMPVGENVPGTPNSPMPPSNLLTSPMVPNAPGVTKPGYGQGLGLSGNTQTNSLMQQQGQQQQPFGALQQQQPSNQQLRGPFNPQQLLQQQQQQQAFLQLAVQAGLINQSLLQQQLTPQLFMAVFQLIQQQMQRYQQLQNLPNKSIGHQQHELILQLATMLQRLQQQPQQQQQNQQRPIQQQRAPYPPRNKSDSDMFNELPGSSGGFNQDLGIKEPQQSRLQQFFNQRQSLNSTKAPEAFGTTLRSDSVASASDMSSRSDGWSRSNSPTTSDMPRSADSAFSDSAGWSFPQSNNDLAGDLSDIGPPEFKPGVPWKPRTKDVANDPHATPGSVNNGILNTPNLPKTENRNSRNDDLTGILTKPMKPPPTTISGSWSTGSIAGVQPGYKKSGWNYPEPVYTPTTLTHEIWRAPLNPLAGGSRNVRPPPGLVEPPSNNSPWQQGNPSNAGRNWSRSQSTTGTSWSGGGDALSNWLVLRNLTPQIDGSTLRLLCNQHGPLEHFQLNLSQGTALIAYRKPDEAIKAQLALHSCVLGNTTVIVDFATAADMARFKDRTQSSSGTGGSGASGSGSGGSGSGSWSHGAGNKYSGGPSQWNGTTSSAIPGLPGSQMWSTGSSNIGWGAGDDGDVSTASSNSFLPGNLLSESSM